MTSPTRLCITRHGEIDWNAAGILQGWLDIPMNGRGREQAMQLAQKFRDAGFSRIHASSLLRARETADMIAAALGLPLPEYHEGLRERSFGAIQGIPKSELAELNPVLFQQILSRNPACYFEQGESMDEFAERVLETLQAIAAQSPGEQVLVITHGWVMDVVTRQVSGLPRNALLHMKPRNGDCLWVEVSRQSMSALPEPELA